MSTLARINGEHGGQQIMLVEVSKLENEAAVRAVRELRQLGTKITHLVFCSPSSRNIPSPDYHLNRLLGVCPSIQHFQYQRGCFDRNIVFSVYRNFASNNRGAYVLVVCSETAVITGGGSRDAIAAAEVEDLQIRLRVTNTELELVRKREHEAQVRAEKSLVRAEKAEAQLRRAEIKLEEIALVARHRSSRT